MQLKGLVGFATNHYIHNETLNLILTLDLRSRSRSGSNPPIHKSQHGPQNIKTGHLNLHVSKKYCQPSSKRPPVQIQIFWIQIRNSRPDPKITEDSGFRFLSFRVSGFSGFFGSWFSGTFRNRLRNPVPGLSRTIS